MTQTEYEQKRHDSWISFKTETMFMVDEDAFCAAFDRAYALGKLQSSDQQVKEAITQEEIEKAAEKFADREYMTNQDEWDDLYKGYYHGMKDALGKQEKDGEEPVIQGWVARDSDRSLYVYRCKPERVRYINGNDGVWTSGTIEALNPALFPDLTWADEPIEVELTIKRKKK